MNGEYKVPSNWKERMKQTEEMDQLEKRAFRAYLFVFVVMCLAAVCLMLLVRSRSEKVSDFNLTHRRVSVLR